MQNEYRAKRSAAIFLATYVTGVEIERRKDPGREKRAAESEGKKGSREFPSIATTA